MKMCFFPYEFMEPWILFTRSLRDPTPWNSVETESARDSVLKVLDECVRRIYPHGLI